MRKIAACNILAGFFLLFFIGMMGFFLRIEVVQQYLFSSQTSSSWRISLFRSAHAHGTLFALIQIVYGLSIPYSCCKKTALLLQSIGLALGAWVMGVLVFFESHSTPDLSSWSWNQLCIGGGLGAWMVAIAWHGYGIAGRIWRE